jgi:hypothetical protein
MRWFADFLSAPVRVASTQL